MKQKDKVGRPDIDSFEATKDEAAMRGLVLSLLYANIRRVFYAEVFDALKSVRFVSLNVCHNESLSCVGFPGT